MRRAVAGHWDGRLVRKAIGLEGQDANHQVEGSQPANSSFSAPCRAPVFAARGGFQFAYFPYQERNALGPQLSKETETVSSLQEAWNCLQGVQVFPARPSYVAGQNERSGKGAATANRAHRPVTRRFVEELGSRLIQ